MLQTNAENHPVIGCGWWGKDDGIRAALKLWQVVVASRAKRGRAKEAVDALGTVLTRGSYPKGILWNSHPYVSWWDGEWHQVAV